MNSTEPQKKTVWYGIGKALKEQSPIRHAERLVDAAQQIVPQLDPKDNAFAQEIRPAIETAALIAGAGITTAEIVVAATAGMNAFRMGRELFTHRKSVTDRLRHVRAAKKRTGSGRYFSPQSLGTVPDGESDDPYKHAFKRAQKTFDRIADQRKTIGVISGGKWEEIPVSKKKIEELKRMFPHVLHTQPKDNMLQYLDLAITAAWGSNQTFPDLYDKSALASHLITEWGKTLPKPLAHNDGSLLYWLWEKAKFVGLPDGNIQSLRAYTDRMIYSDEYYARIKASHRARKQSHRQVDGVPLDDASKWQEPSFVRDVEPSGKLRDIAERNTIKMSAVYPSSILRPLDAEAFVKTLVDEQPTTRRKREQHDRLIRRANRLGKADWKRPEIAAGIESARRAAGDTSVMAYDVARLLDRVDEVRSKTGVGDGVTRVLNQLMLEEQYGGTEDTRRQLARDFLNQVNSGYRIFENARVVDTAADYWINTLHGAELSRLLPHGPNPEARRAYIQKLFIDHNWDRLTNLVITRINDVSNEDENTPFLVHAVRQRMNAGTNQHMDGAHPPKELTQLLGKGYRLLLDTKSEEARSAFDKIRAARHVSYDYSLTREEQGYLKQLAHHILTNNPDQVLAPVIADAKFSPQRIKALENKEAEGIVQTMRKWKEQNSASIEESKRRAARRNILEFQNLEAKRVDASVNWHNPALVAQVGKIAARSRIEQINTRNLAVVLDDVWAHREDPAVSSMILKFLNARDSGNDIRTIESAVELLQSARNRAQKQGVNGMENLGLLPLANVWVHQLRAVGADALLPDVPSDARYLSLRLFNAPDEETKRLVRIVANRGAWTIHEKTQVREPLPQLTDLVRHGYRLLRDIKPDKSLTPTDELTVRAMTIDFAQKGAPGLEGLYEKFRA